MFYRFRASKNLIEKNDLAAELQLVVKKMPARKAMSKFVSTFKSGWTLQVIIKLLCKHNSLKEYLWSFADLQELTSRSWGGSPVHLDKGHQTDLQSIEHITSIQQRYNVVLNIITGCMRKKLRYTFASSYECFKLVTLSPLKSISPMNFATRWTVNRNTTVLLTSAIDGARFTRWPWRRRSGPPTADSATAGCSCHRIAEHRRASATATSLWNLKVAASATTICKGLNTSTEAPAICKGRFTAVRTRQVPHGALKAAASIIGTMLSRRSTAPCNMSEQRWKSYP